MRVLLVTNSISRATVLQIEKRAISAEAIMIVLTKIKASNKLIEKLLLNKERALFRALQSTISLPIEMLKMVVLIKELNLQITFINCSKN